MKTAMRILSTVLCLVLLGACISGAGAEAVTLNVYLSGIRIAADGTETTVKLDGRFRIYRNGEEAGIIAAGESITLPDGERIRVEPMAEFIEPGWDLSGAAVDVSVTDGRSVTVPIVLRPLNPAAAAEEPQDAPADADPVAEPESVSEPETASKAETAETPETVPETEPDVPESAEDGPDAPARLPFAEETVTPEPAPAAAVTPEPQIAPLEPAENTGTVRMLVFNDKNGNGYMGSSEDGIPGVQVYLLRGEEIIAGAKTDRDGMAVFENVPDGIYRTQTWLPDGKGFSDYGTDGRLDANCYAFTTEQYQTGPEFQLAAGQEALQGVGIQASYHVGGICWEESEVDGLYKKGENMVGGVRITLDGQKNGLHYETVSNPDGSWRIDRVRPAFYTLTVYVPEGMMFTRYTGTSGTRSVFTQEGVTKGSKTIDLNDRVSKEKQHIGFARSAVVRGICYIDANYNGYYDEGEQPLAGVKVTAIKQGNDEEIAVTRSEADGTFRLTGLRGNTYKIRAVLPEDGSTFTVYAGGPLGNHFRSRAERRENFWTDFVLDNAETREIAIGAVYPATIKGTVYYDDDFSATQNGSERIVSGFQVTLLDADGNAFTSDKTSVRGVYELTGVVPGEYTLSVSAVRGYAFTRPGDGNTILNRTGGEGYSRPFRVESGDRITGMDIGMIKPGTVEGDVFADLNDNGLRDSGERGLEGVTVRLMGEEGEAFRAVIGGDGHFIFDAVMPGTYYVEYILPEDAVFARTASGGNAVDSTESFAKTEAFTFKTGDYRAMPLCGALTLGRIDGTAFEDHNGNGMRDSGEETLAGMTVSLIPSRGDLEEITAVTGPDGSFVLPDLRPDTYTLRAVCPEGYVMSRTDGLDLPLTAGKAEQSVSLSLPMGSCRTGQVTGAVIPAAIRGRVWLDENDNGIFDEGEATPAGLTVTVTDESTGKVFDTPVTDAEGNFSAAGMIPGKFTVSFPLDEDTIPPRPGDSRFTAADGRMELTGIELGENEVRDGLLLGIVRYTRVAGRVWIDRGQAIEPLSGARISLTDGNGTEISSAVTGESGEYRFLRLMPGEYRLLAEMPEGCVIIEPDDPRLSGGTRSVIDEPLNRTGSTAVFSLKMDHNLEEMDIGCVLPGTLGDFCWLDLDGDGLQGAGEGGIPGVRVEAQRNGVTVAEAVTDQYGFYRIPDLYPAVYILRVTPPAEVKPTVRRTDIRLIASVLTESEGETCESAEVTVESNRANLNADLGFVLRKKDVYPAGYGEGKTQDWSRK